jgi:hypothetical protein
MEKMAQTCRLVPEPTGDAQYEGAGGLHLYDSKYDGMSSHMTPIQIRTSYILWLDVNAVGAGCPNRGEADYRTGCVHGSFGNTSLRGTSYIGAETPVVGPNTVADNSG